MATLAIRGDIGGPGLTETDFADRLDAIPDSEEVRLLIASDGGSVFTALSAISQLSRRTGGIVVEVESLAASAATFFLAIADRVEMHPHAMAMIHESQAGTIGSHADMTKMASVLRMIDQDIASLYARRSFTSQNDWLRLMAVETWATAGEAVSIGLADVVLPARGEKVARRQVPKAAMNRTSEQRAILNRMVASRNSITGREVTTRAVLAGYAERISEITRDLAADERRANRSRIVANAKGDKGRASRFLAWS